MRLLLTGATGFLGRHIIAAATNWTLTRLTRAVEPTQKDEIALGPAPWTRTDFAMALVKAQPDVVVHCAGVVQSSNPRVCIDANAVLAAELLGAVGELQRAPRVILIGSAAEYGVVSLDAQPVMETHPCAPRSDYAVAKCAQSLLGFAAAMRGQRVLTARLFNPVGIGMPSGLALPSFARQIVAPGPSPLLRVGDLTTKRDFLDVAEAARLLIALASMPDWPWPVVNVCSGRPYRISDLLDGLIVESGVDVRVEIDPALMRTGDMPSLTGSTKRLESIGLMPQAPDFSSLLPRLLDEARNLNIGVHE